MSLPLVNTWLSHYRPWTRVEWLKILHYALSSHSLIVLSGSQNAAQTSHHCRKKHLTCTYVGTFWRKKPHRCTWHCDYAPVGRWWDCIQKSGGTEWHTHHYRWNSYRPAKQGRESIKLNHGAVWGLFQVKIQSWLFTATVRNVIHSFLTSLFVTFISF